MFTVITLADSDSIAARSEKLYRFCLKSGAVPRSEESLWQAVIDTFPLDPRKSSPGRVLDALEDSLFGGLLGAGHSEVDVLWRYADHTPRDFLSFGVEFFQQLAESLHPNERAKNGEDGVLLHLYLVCANHSAREDLDRTLRG